MSEWMNGNIDRWMHFFLVGIEGMIWLCTDKMLNVLQGIETTLNSCTSFKRTCVASRTFGWTMGLGTHPPQLRHSLFCLWILKTIGFGTCPRPSYLLSCITVRPLPKSNNLHRQARTHVLVILSDTCRPWWAIRNFNGFSISRQVKQVQKRFSPFTRWTQAESWMPLASSRQIWGNSRFCLAFKI